MLELVTGAALTLVALGVAARLLTANAFWRWRDRSFFPEAVRQFLISKQDGGELIFRQRGGALRLCVRRGPGPSAHSARLTLQLQEEEAARAAAAGLVERLRARGFEWRLDAAARGEVDIEVSDIWEPDAGEVCGWALRCAVDALAVPQSARFIIDMRGRESLRAVQRLRSRWRG